MEKWIYASATALARAIRAKEVSSEEVVNACLARIEQVNPQLNAVVGLTADEALNQARKADAALTGGELWGPLHGVPITIKDSLDTAGFLTSWGTPGRAAHVPSEDATVVARMKAAGAILLGKTNTPELTLAFETDNPVYGRTNNPYDLERTPGGSSGGEGAIIAAGGSPLGLGSDTGGSIRVPSHFCGISGIRPTSGRVPRTGHAIPPGGIVDSLTQLGPIARHVEDLALVLPLIAGVDGRDPAVVPMPAVNTADLDLNGIRAAFHIDNGIQAPTPETANAVKAAAEALSMEGVILEEKRPPGIEETFEIFLGLLVGWDGGAWIRLLLDRAGTAVTETSLGALLPGQALSADEIVRLVDRWDRFRSRMLSFLDTYDLILSPVNAYPALPHGEAGHKLTGFSYTMTYNLTGWPAAVVRAGTSPEGLPIGVQVVARPWREDVALAGSACVERALGGWQRPRL
jgi:amidase